MSKRGSTKSFSTTRRELLRAAQRSLRNLVIEVMLDEELEEEIEKLEEEILLLIDNLPFESC